jgi:hypothetical protein
VHCTLNLDSSCHIKREDENIQNSNIIFSLRVRDLVSYPKGRTLHWVLCLIYEGQEDGEDYNEELHISFPSLNYVGSMKWTRMRRVEHAARIGTARNTYRTSVGKLKKNRHSEDLSVVGRFSTKMDAKHESSIWRYFLSVSSSNLRHVFTCV